MVKDDDLQNGETRDEEETEKSEPEPGRRARAVALMSRPLRGLFDRRDNAES